MAFTGCWAPAVRCCSSSAPSSGLARITLDRVQQLCDVLLSGLVHLNHRTLEKDNLKKKRCFNHALTSSPITATQQQNSFSSIFFFFMMMMILFVTYNIFGREPKKQLGHLQGLGDAKIFIREVPVPSVASRNANFQCCLF